MTRNSKNTLVNAVMLAVVAGSFGLMGCGSDMSTAPVFGTIAQDEPGELNYPTKTPKVETPRGFKAESLGGFNVSLTWAAPRERNLVALLKLDGISIAEVPATSGVYLDTMGKPSGDHTYEVCFMRGKVGSRAIATSLVIRPAGSGGDGGRTDDHPELDD